MEPPLHPTELPRHLAVIMDGNGRWAQARGLTRSQGHTAGTTAARAFVARCRELGIGHVTLYAFSRENWGRPKDEVESLFELMRRFLDKELDTLLAQDIRLNVLGDVDALPLLTRKALAHTVARTAKGRAMVLNLALNYSGRDELVRAARRMVQDGLAPAQITEQALAERLYTAGQPDPDLIIRTSGELRLSNYLLFQCAYSELYFTPTLWPDFDAAELDKALADYATRKRRFGKTAEQIGPTP